MNKQLRVKLSETDPEATKETVVKKLIYYEVVFGENSRKSRILRSLAMEQMIFIRQVYGTTMTFYF
jgi:hypothetical protein